MTAYLVELDDPRVLRALDEFRRLIRQRYPDATFEVTRGIDDPEAIHLVATVDVDDLDEVADLVMDRMMELQIDEELPIFVIPERPISRTIEELRRRRGLDQVQEG